MNEACTVDAVRTGSGTATIRGALSAVRPVALLATAPAALVELV